MKEADIQRRIIEYLERHGWMVTKIIQTTMNGWPDLQCIRQHPEMVYIEVKRPGEKPEPLQQYRHKQLRDRGWTVIVADKIDDVRHLA